MCVQWEEGREAAEFRGAEECDYRFFEYCLVCLRYCLSALLRAYSMCDANDV